MVSYKEYKREKKKEENRKEVLLIVEEYFKELGLTKDDLSLLPQAIKDIKELKEKQDKEPTQSASANNKKIEKENEYDVKSFLRNFAGGVEEEFYPYGKPKATN